MKNSRKRGIIRKTDELGRVVIPKEIRRTLDIKNQEDLEIMLVGETIVIQKPITCCIHCGNQTSELAEKVQLNLCDNCIDKFAVKLQEVKTGK